MKKQKVLLSIIVTLFWFALCVCRPYQTTYLSALGVGQTLIGTVLGAYGVAQMALRLPAGMLADTASRHKVFVFLGSLFSGASSVFRLTMDNAAGYLLANLSGGIAAAMWISFMILYLDCYEKDVQQRATARVFLFNNLGMLLAFAAGAAFYDRIGMRGLCVLSCAAGGIAAVLALFLADVQKTEMLNKPSVGKLLRALGSRGLIFFAVLAIVQQGVEAATTMAFTSQIVESLSGSSFLVGCSSVIYMVSSVVFSAFASSRMCAKKTPAFWIVGGFLSVLAYCVLVPLAGNVYVILVLQSLPGVSTGILLSFLTGEAMADVPAEAKSTCMGFYQAVYSVGITCFPILTGKIAGAVSMQTSYFVMGAIALVCAFAAYLYYRVDRR